MMHVCWLPAAGEEICGGLMIEGPDVEVATDTPCGDAAAIKRAWSVPATVKVDATIAMNAKSFRGLIS